MFKGPHGKTPAATEERVVALIRKRFTRNVIARKVGIGASTVGRIAKTAGLVCERGVDGRPKGTGNAKPKVVKLTLVSEGKNWAAEARHLRWDQE